MQGTWKNEKIKPCYFWLAFYKHASIFVDGERKGSQAVTEKAVPGTDGQWNFNKTTALAQHNATSSSCALHWPIKYVHTVIPS